MHLRGPPSAPVGGAHGAAPGPVAYPSGRGYSQEAMIELSLVGVRVELPSNQPIVLLREREGKRYLPIWIGVNEAQAIAIALQGIATPRPMTHDLMKNLLDEVGVHVERITITELRDGIFYAVVQLARN